VLFVHLVIVVCSYADEPTPYTPLVGSDESQRVLDELRRSSISPFAERIDADDRQRPLAVGGTRRRAPPASALAR
jgi:hypothetical protein